MAFENCLYIEPVLPYMIYKAMISEIEQYLLKESEL